MKVKIFNCASDKSLEKDINDFFKKTPQARANLIDIKYQVSTGILQSQNESMIEGSFEIHAAMIIYK